MTDFDIIETHRMPDGTEYRAALAVDPDPQAPYDDGGWPILRVQYRHYDYDAEPFNSQAELYVDKFNELFERLRILGAWERYAKIFLGASQVHEWGFNQATDYAYIAFDPAAWRKAMGWKNDAEAIEKLAGEDPLAEIKAWLTGEVYGRVIHTRWNPDESLEDDEGWTDFEEGYWVWGYYGRQYAETAAKEELAAVVSNHKEVHRYTEHEKIAPHQTAIDAIMEFLEVHTLQGHTAVRGGHQQMVFEHFGIDYKKIKEERELMFKRLQQDASVQAGLSIKKSQEATDK